MGKATEEMLEIRELSKFFGGLQALNSVSLKITQREIFGLIGPNGSGKTTLFNLITGIYKVTSGNIYYNGTNITDLKPHQTPRLGISRTFQNLRLFPKMTVSDNLKVAQSCICRSKFSNVNVFRTKEEAVLEEERDGLLDLVGLKKRRNELAQNLSFGEQKRLEIARALGLRPVLLLLDEPAGGMNPVEVRDLKDLILQIRSTGKTIFLVEHNMSLIMDISDRIAVLNFGTKIAEGTPFEISKNTLVIEAYLGKEER